MSVSCKIKADGLCRRFVARKWHQLKSDQNGSTAVEFACVAFPFFLLLATTIEVLSFFIAGQVLENVVDQAGRKLRTGQLKAGSTREDLEKEVCDQAAGLFDCEKLFISLQTAQSFGELPPPPGPVGGMMNKKSFGYKSPGPEIVMRLTVSYKWPVFTNYVGAYLSSLDDGKALLTAMSLFRSEPYS